MRPSFAPGTGFLLAVCAFPLLHPALAQTAPSQAIHPTQLAAPSASVWGRALTPAQRQVLEQRSL